MNIKKSGKHWLPDDTYLLSMEGVERLHKAGLQNGPLMTEILGIGMKGISRSAAEKLIDRVQTAIPGAQKIRFLVGKKQLNRYHTVVSARSKKTCPGSLKAKLKQQTLYEQMKVTYAAATTAATTTA